MSAFLNVFLPKNGNPCKYYPEVDAAFILWLEDPARTCREKMMDLMVAMYNRISVNLKKPITSVNEQTLIKHIRRLYQARGYSMRTPKLVEAKMCAIMSTLIE